MIRIFFIAALVGLRIAGAERAELLLSVFIATLYGGLTVVVMYAAWSGTVFAIQLPQWRMATLSTVALTSVLLAFGYWLAAALAFMPLLGLHVCTMEGACAEEGDKAGKEGGG